jgi:predicted DNA-binding transcriptional regulator AlpA
MSEKLHLDSDPYLRASAIAKSLGVHRSTLWRWTHAGNFPKPIQLSPDISVWRKSTVDAWRAAKEQG